MPDVRGVTMVRRRWLRITGLPRYERGLWGSSRVVVCDSLHPTNGSVNPTLTLAVNAIRVAEQLVSDWPR